MIPPVQFFIGKHQGKNKKNPFINDALRTKASAMDKGSLQYVAGERLDLTMFWLKNGRRICCGVLVFYVVRACR